MMFFVFNFRCLISFIVPKHSLYDFYSSRLLFGDFFLLVDGVEALVNVSRACEVTGVWGGIASQ